MRVFLLNNRLIVHHSKNFSRPACRPPAYDACAGDVCGAGRYYGVDCFLMGEYNIHTLHTPYEHKRLFGISFTIGN